MNAGYELGNKLGMSQVDLSKPTQSQNLQSRKDVTNTEFQHGADYNLRLIRWQVECLFGAMEALDAESMRERAELLAKTLEILPPELA